MSPRGPPWTRVVTPFAAWVGRVRYTEMLSMPLSTIERTMERE